VARRILVCGSRDWEDPALIRQVLDEQVQLRPHDVIIQGGCRGADRMAAMVARTMGATIETYPADWRRNGRAAGPQRNILMLNTHPNLIVAFQLNDSKGTAHVIAEARARGIPVIRVAVTTKV
jgi:hypothetical protein